MSRAETKAVTPRLRFPEFRDAGPWEVKRLGEVLEEFRKQSTVQDEYEVLTSSTRGLLRQKEYYEENRITARENIGFNIIPPNHITYRSRSDNRKFYFNENNLGITGIVSIYYPVFGVIEGSNKFITELLNHKWIEVGKYSVGTSQTVLSMNELKRIKMALPAPAEQQKIADCLSSLDELIRAEDARLEALQAHKKGLMQQLFPVEGETTPRLRFPEFRNAGPWEVKQLGEIAEVVRGGSPRPISQFLTTDDDGFNWLKIGDIATESKYVLSTEEKIKKTGLSKTREVQPGDLILSNSMSFGRPYIVGIRACIHDGWLALTDLKSEWLSEYLYYFILSDLSQRYLHDAAAGGGVRNLNADIVKLLPIAIPLRAEEQQKIADCLSSLDDLIRTQGERIEALKQHKKGLMQQLFPQEVA